MADIEQLESRRLQLEENVARLRKSLQNWRAWNVEYEGLKEELQTDPIVQSEADCVRISNTFAGDVVTEKEIFDLFGVGKGPVRSPKEVIRLINRRLDYVEQNVSTVSKQLRSVEEQLSEVLEEIDRENEDPEGSGLPMTEIIEELDEEGNIISSKVTQPEGQTAQIIDTLRKAGLTEVDSKAAEPSRKDERVQQGQSANSKEGSPATINQKFETSNTEITNPEEKKPSRANAGEKSPEPAKKSVKFAETIQERTIPANGDNGSSVKASAAAPSLVKGSFAPGQRVIELDEDDEMVGATAVIPDDESPEDARLRREMIQYSLNEVGQVVAELDLDENLSDFEDDDFEFEDEYDSEISEEEDEHGRSIRPGVSKDYKQQMLDLEQKLKDRVIGNLGPLPEGVDPVVDPDDLRRLVVRGDGEATSELAVPNGKQSVRPDGSAKKGVRFSDVLDVSEAPKAPTTQTAPPPKPRSAPIADIVERTAPKPQLASQTSSTAKPSRFKQSRAPEPSTQIPGHNEGPVLSEKVMERPSAPTAARAPEVDEFDPELQQRQLAAEYYRMRNNVIRQQGGFKANEEDQDDPLMEEVDGKVKKVSRFKAARMKF